MRFIACSVLLLVASITAQQDFDCKPRPGCHLVRCDPEKGHSASSLFPMLARNDFPITCVSRSSPSITESREDFSKSASINGVSDLKEEVEGQQEQMSEMLMDLQSLWQAIKELNAKQTESLEHDIELKKIVKELEVTNNTNPAKSVKSDFCPIRYNGSCFWVEIRYRGVNCQQAREICANQNGKTADIYSEDHYYVILAALRQFAIKYGWVDAWIGMRYQPPPINDASLTDGRAAPFVKWHPGYPMQINQTCVGLLANMDWRTHNQHLVNNDATWTKRGVVCERLE